MLHFANVFVTFLSFSERRAGGDKPNANEFNGFGERMLGSVVGAVFLPRVDQFVVLIHAQHAVWAEALDGKGTGQGLDIINPY